MAGADAFAVSPSALVAYAASVDSAAGTVDSGRRAGDRVRLGDSAFGMLCQALPALLHPVQDAVLSAMSDAGGALHTSAASLRTAAETYRAFDRDAAAALDGVTP